MDKRVIFAVAGAGKTTHIVDRLEETTRALIVTYTNNNLYNLKLKIRQKFGYIPETIKVCSYFSFVYGFCYRPFLLDRMKTTGIFYEPNLNRAARKTEDSYYLSPARRLYSNRIALLVQERALQDAIRARLSKYYDLFIVDEAQDFSAHDFNLLLELLKADVNVLLVGDFYQYTYATSFDGNVRKNLHKDYAEYKECFAGAGLIVDETSFLKSYRCSLTTCRFVNDNLAISIESHGADETEVRELNDDEIDRIATDKAIVKLFYQNSSKYGVFGRNWGDSKGEDRYDDVCIVLNPNTYSLYKRNRLNSLTGMTRNKLYVAITRARGNVYFVEQAKLDSYLRTAG